MIFYLKKKVFDLLMEILFSLLITSVDYKDLFIIYGMEVTLATLVGKANSLFG